MNAEARGIVFDLRANGVQRWWPVVFSSPTLDRIIHDRTHLDGKNDADGRKTAPLRVSLPFQTVETVNESAQERQRMLDLFSAGPDPEWRNRLIWGDKKYVLPSLLEEFAGKVKLIYIDPPLNVGADFSFTTAIHPEDEDDIDGATFTKEPSIIEQKAYHDTWGRGLDPYLQWFYETAELLRELLAENGSIYVHLDWHVAHYAKAILDEVFGKQDDLHLGHDSLLQSLMNDLRPTTSAIPRSLPASSRQAQRDDSSILEVDMT